MTPRAAASIMVLAAAVAVVFSKAAYNSVTGDLCGKMNGRRYYLEVSTRAEVVAVNVTIPPYSPRLATLNPAQLATSLHYLPSSTLARHRRSADAEFLRRLFNSPSQSPPPPVSPSSQNPPPSASSPSSHRPSPPTRPSSSRNPPPPANTFPTRHPPFNIPARMMREDLKEEQKEELTGSEEDVALNQPFKCGAEFFTCPECHLEFIFTSVNLPSCSHDRSCRCDYVRVREPPYASDGGRDLCATSGGGDGSGGGLSFATQTREAIVDFLYAHRYSHAFTLTITARRNQYQITGKGNLTLGHIRSPYFPELYPKDHWMEYQLVARDTDSRIKVNFLDFLLSPWSFVQVEDTNKSRLATFSGNTFRPPILVSSGPHLTIRFNGNGETARGFNLQYSFVSKASLETYLASTDCGGFVTNFGGTITMMQMARGARNFTLYDCVWIIQPPHNFAFKSHLSIKVVQFEEMVPGTMVEIRQGVTSEDYLLETVTAGRTGAGAGAGTEAGVGGRAAARATAEGSPKSREHVAAADTGFYVRLRGSFSKDSKLAIVYTSFSYLGSCYSLTDLMCQNHRCIPKMLRCDGFDHCGDNSDEPSSCYVGPGNKSLTPEDAAWWYENTPNYYFPRKNSMFIGNGHGWSSLLLMASLVVLVMMVFGLISYMFKTGVQPRPIIGGSRERRGGHSRTSLSDSVEIFDFDAVADDPPNYEPPPDYEDVIKLILSGNNLKLVRRPGGVTAWVPNKLVGEGMEAERPLRTRHASLDLEQDMEVVLWNTNDIVNPRNGGHPTLRIGGVEPQPAVAPHPILTHVRRSSLPVAPLPEVLQEQGHGVSIAPETITEAPEGMDSPLSVFRPVQLAIRSPQISVHSFNYDSSAASTPESSTSRVLTPASTSGRKLLKKGGRRKKRTSTTRRPVRRQDDIAPPSYEAAMQQFNHCATPDLCPAESLPTSQVSESTQTSLDLDNDLTPTDRLRAAREMFQRMSRDEKEIEGSHASSGRSIALKRPTATAVHGRHVRTGSNGSSISHGTVRTRKAMLLRSQKPQPACTCHGACSCAILTPEEESRTILTTGGVRSKVSYYEATSGRESDDPTVPISELGTKKKRLVRNRSVPAINLACLRDQAKVTEEKMEASEESCTQECDGEEELLERPLITPVSEMLPVVVMAQDQAVTSIKTQVKLYDHLSHSCSCIASSYGDHPSPVTSPQPTSPRNDSAVTEGSVKPGLVREARTRFITALQQDLPKLIPVDSDDCVVSSPPVLVPYMNLKNEEPTTPELPNPSPLSTPLRHDQAKSIEQWDACSNGCFSPLHHDNLPSSASGAVPKKSSVPSQVTTRSQATPSHSGPSGGALDQAQMAANRTGFTLPLVDKFSPAITTNPNTTEGSSLSGSADYEKDNMLEITLATPGATSKDTPPSTPHHRHLDVTLNKTFDSDTDQEVEVQGELVSSPSVSQFFSLQPPEPYTQPQPQPQTDSHLQFQSETQTQIEPQSQPQPQPHSHIEPLTQPQPKPQPQLDSQPRSKPKTKIPVPSPRGSKMPQTVTVPDQPSAPCHRATPSPPHPRTSCNLPPSRTPSPKPQSRVIPQPDPESPMFELGDGVNSPTPTNPSCDPSPGPRPSPPGPQIENGVITIQVCKRARHSYI